MAERLLPGPRFSLEPRTIRAVVSDVDNTLLPNESLGKPTPRVAEAFKLASERIPVGLATARQPQKALYLSHELRLTGNSILSNGAQIYNGAEQVMVVERQLPVETTMEVARTLQSHNIDHWIQDDGYDHRWVPETSTPRKDRRMSKGIGTYKRPVDVKDPTKGQELVRSYTPRKPFIIVAHNVSAENVTNIRNFIAGFENQNFISFVGHENIAADGSLVYQVFITDKRTNKSYALSEVAEMAKLPMQEFMGMGDGPNDKVLVETAGTGVAMGNGVDETKAVAVYIAPRREDDGAAVALETLVLNK